jgi:hypothetical protein
VVAEADAVEQSDTSATRPAVRRSARESENIGVATSGRLTQLRAGSTVDGYAPSHDHVE